MEFDSGVGPTCSVFVFLMVLLLFMTSMDLIREVSLVLIVIKFLTMNYCPKKQAFGTLLGQLSLSM